MKTNWPALRSGCLIFTSMAVAMSPAPAQTQEPAGASKSAAVISSVAITQAPERSAVRVEGEGRLEVHPARMHNPDRLVLDFVGARLAVHRTAIPGVSAPVLGVRMGQYQPDVARVVVDLTAPTPYEVSRDRDAVVISFETSTTTPANVSTRATLTTTLVDEKVRPHFEYGALAPRKPAGSAHSFQIPAPRFSLPSELTQPSITLASFSGKNEPARPQQAAQQAVQQATTAATTMAATAAQAAPPQ